jgi:hypothetical protein
MPVTLNPTEPPARRSRKALRYAPEIAHLRREGYTCAAIRRVLLDAGLSVSLSTVKREAARASKPTAAHPTRAVSELALPMRTHVVAPSLPFSPAFAGDPRTSKEIAAAFVKGRITNPLLRSRITP